MEKPTIKQRLSSFGTFLYDSSKGTVLGRGPRSWCEITTFYVIFFACLAGFFAATMAGFYQTIDEKQPRLQGESSLLRANPGMGYEPMPDIDTTLIYARMPQTDNKEYVKSINKVLQSYKAENLDNVDCTGEMNVRLDEKVACAVDYDNLTRGCNEENAYGMAEGKPCILLKLNRIYDWVPRVWTEEEFKSANPVADSFKANYTADKIWIDCHGENPADNDNLGLDDVEYFPQQGFPLAYYPYKNQKDYRSPLVFVKFNGVAHHLALMIECKALAKNIAVDRSEKEGGVHFELLVDP
jgi:sodium/potassium-transporting ATPase subunit beta